MITAAIGWFGTFGTLGAYLMLWRGRVTAQSLAYALLNAVGGTLSGAASIAYGAWPAAAASLVWAVIAVHTAWTLGAARLKSYPTAVARWIPSNDRMDDASPDEPTVTALAA